MKADGKLWVKNTDRSQVMKLDPVTGVYENLGSFKVKHQLSDNWTVEFGGLYQDAIRNLFGITNTLTNDAGAYTVTNVPFNTYKVSASAPALSPSTTRMRGAGMRVGMPSIASTTLPIMISSPG